MTAIGKITQADTKRPILLLIEDNPADATLLTTQFEGCGFLGSWEWVEDGEVGLDYLFRRGKYEHALRPDLVILDLNLPKVHGREVLRAMRSDSGLRSIPVVVLTTSNRHEDMLMSYGFGTSCFLTKPRDLAGFEDMAERLVKIELPRAMK